MTTPRGIKRRVKIAAERIGKLMQSDGSKFGRGLASEGYLGGYQQALYDVELLLNGVEPNDDRRIWRDPDKIR